MDLLTKNQFTMKIDITLLEEYMAKMKMKLRVHEVSLAANPKNRQRFILVKDKGGIMNKLANFLALIASKADVSEVIKEELKDTDTKLNKTDIIACLKDLGISFEAKDFMAEGESVVKTAEVEIVKKDSDMKVVDTTKFDVLAKDSYTLKEEHKYANLDPEIRKDIEDSKKTILQLRKDRFVNDVVQKIGKEHAEKFEVLFDSIESDALDSILNVVVSLQETIKDLGKKVGSVELDGLNENEATITREVEKLAKDQKISVSDAWVEYAKANPEKMKSLDH